MLATIFVPTDEAASDSSEACVTLGFMIFRPSYHNHNISGVSRSVDVSSASYGKEKIECYIRFLGHCFFAAGEEFLFYFWPIDLLNSRPVEVQR
jgi:hypothetical protein